MQPISLSKIGRTTTCHCTTPQLPTVVKIPLIGDTLPPYGTVVPAARAMLAHTRCMLT